MNRRRTALVLATAAVLALTLGTGGFSSASLERNIDVGVAPDDRAYVGIERLANGCGFRPRLALTDRLSGTDLHVDDVEVVSTSGDVTVNPPGAEVRSSENGLGTVRIDVVPDGSEPADDGTESITIGLTVRGDGVTVSLERTVPVLCTPGDNESSPGAGPEEPETRSTPAESGDSRRGEHVEGSLVEDGDGRRTADPTIDEQR